MIITKTNFDILNTCIKKGLDFLSSEQLPWGEFPSFDFSWEDEATYYPNVYSTAFIINSIKDTQDYNKQIFNLRNEAKNFLISNKEENYFWRYFGKGYKWFNRNIVNYDFDTISVVATALLQFNIHFPEIANSILSNIDTQTGLIKTWLNPSNDFENDIDIIVNANIAIYFNQINRIEYLNSVMEYLQTGFWSNLYRW